MATKRQKAGPVPKDALEFLRKKGLKPAFSYLDVWREEHSLAFTVAKLMEEDLLADVKRTLERAIEDGIPFETWAGEVQPILDRSGWSAFGTPEQTPSRLWTIYDTNVRMARAVGQWQRIERTRRTHPYLMYLLGPAKEHRAEHAAWAGLVLPSDDPWWDTHMPPNGYGCFLPGTRITGNVLGASKAMYSGEAIELVTQGGATVAVTPNHPIATPEGWIPAGELRVGRYCFSHREEVELLRSSSGRIADRAIGDDDIPPPVENVFDALASKGASVLRPSPLDFHGEAQFFDGQVDVVGSYIQLVKNGSHAAQQPGQLPFSGMDPRLLAEPGRSDSAHLLLPRKPALGSAPGLTALADRGGAIHPGPFDAAGLGSPSRRNAVPQKKDPKGRAAHPAFVGELLSRFAGAVALDKLVSIRRFPFCGHVYDLESVAGWVFASGIVASNCKCHVRQLTKREAERYGINTAPAVELVEWEHPQRGRMLVPAGIQPGFDHNPGKERARRLREEAR